MPDCRRGPQGYGEHRTAAKPRRLAVLAQVCLPLHLVHDGHRAIPRRAHARLPPAGTDDLDDHHDDRATPCRWRPCNGPLAATSSAASVTVPLDYGHPDGATIQIAVARHPAEIPSERIGSIVINPGGPGGSGIDDLPKTSSRCSHRPARPVRHRLLRPAGGRSARHRSPARPARARARSGSSIDPVPTTSAAASSRFSRTTREFAAACERLSGAILPYVGTVDTARDLDRIRAALGDAQLTFIGHSYGTLLGATYAELFPTHVRAMVLDGAIDPALSATAYATQQAESFESELDSFFAWCAGDSSCPWRPAGDPTAALLALIQASRDPSAPVRQRHRGTRRDLRRTPRRSRLPVVVADPRRRARRRRGRQRRRGHLDDRSVRNRWFDQRRRRRTGDRLPRPPGRPRSPRSIRRSPPRPHRCAPVFGPLLTWGLLGCATWPALPTRTPAPASDPGAPPILVVGTSEDPVTPYRGRSPSPTSSPAVRSSPGTARATWPTSTVPCVRASVESLPDRRDPAGAGRPPAPTDPAADSLPRRAAPLVAASFGIPERAVRVREPACGGSIEVDGGTRAPERSDRSAPLDSPEHLVVTILTTATAGRKLNASGDLGSVRRGQLEQGRDREGLHRVPAAGGRSRGERGVARRGRTCSPTTPPTSSTTSGPSPARTPSTSGSAPP